MKAIIFDLGNVLINYDHLGMLTAVGQLTNTPDQPLDAPPDLIEQFVTGKINGRSFHQTLVNRAILNADYDAFVAAFNSTMGRNETAIAYAISLLNKPALKVGIISNTNPIHVAWLRKHVPELARFHALILSNDVGLEKPDAAIYQLALAQLGVQPQQALFIDDFAPNIAGAKAVGIHAVQHQEWEVTKTAVETFIFPEAA